MIALYSVAEAREKILRRDNAFLFELDTLSEAQRAASTRLYGEPLTPEEGVRHILKDVRARGDAALRYWTQRLDGVAIDTWRVPPATIAAAPDQIDPALRDALVQAAERIRAFHEHQPLPNWSTSALGGRLGQRVTPIGRVGIYVPGGTAPLPSTLLMCAVPAQVAGVRELVVVTPPAHDSSGGHVPVVILAAAALIGIDTIYTVGGAQAIGALTFGTSSIARVDKIVGPGNMYVTLAKRQVYGIVGIDGLYGPTETVVVADETANPAWVAADMLAQAEHDVLATAILFTPSRAIAAAVQAAIGRQVETLSRAEIITQSLANQGGIVLTADMAEACALASEFAAEHTCIASTNPQPYIDLIPDAGGLFVGERSFEVLGDYIAGPSHTMPTGATARFASPLNVADFVKISSIVELDAATAGRLSPLAARIAQAEGLDGHAAAARQRADQG